MHANAERTFLRWSAACVVLFALNNLAIGPLMAHIRPSDRLAVVVYAAMGVITGEAALHAIWFVFAPLGLAKRFVGGVGAGAVLVGAWAAGIAFLSGGYFSSQASFWVNVLRALLSLPLLCLAAQSPLWMAKHLLRWRVGFQADGSGLPVHRGFGIRDMLILTGVVAVALSLPRLVAKPAVRSPVAVLAVTALVIVGVSLVTTIPAVVATLRARRLRVALPVLLLIDLAIVLVPSGIVCVFWAPPGLSWPEAWGMGIVAGSYFASLTAGLLGARRLGLRLAWGRRQDRSQAKSPPAELPADDTAPVCYTPRGSE